ncbi:Glycosyl transferase family 2 [Gaiella occulta]|uniref:Glucosyl-3-phosphoglycerate synthase n=1 Tax=Gaiella occulta TaxID=1002870 RepID=A0A7M2YYW0_9ACTN|nr:glycosyltransferase [Gaiella occulta]RDI75068.1 Glycosyl transferase family 2 [Gaiella occulta]
MTGELTILVAARDEEERIAATVLGLRDLFPEAAVVVADDGSRDGTAAAAERAGARVIRLQRRGKGQALALAERRCPPGPLLLCDADLAGDLRPLVGTGADLAIAAFARRQGGGFGIAKRAARALIRARAGFDAGEPLSGQRALSPRARAAVFPVAAGFGVETRMTIDAVRAGLQVREIELDLAHRATGRDLRGFLHRGRQLAQIVLACGPQGVNFRGLRLPLVGALVGLAQPSSAPVAAIGLADDLWSGPERGFCGHLRGGATTGTLKLVGIPLYALLRTRSLSGALLVGLCANTVNQLDTRPGRALKGFALGALLLRRVPRGAAGMAVLLAPYDLREMAMLGDAGSNALGAVLGFASVRTLTGRRRWGAIGALAALTLVGERRSLGRLIESTPLLRELDAAGRTP